MEQAWLNAYPEGIPADIDADKYPNIVELLKSGIQKYPNKAAFIHRTGSTERRVSFRELDELSDNFAAYLQHFTNLAPGDRIAIQMPNLLQYPVALFGALKAGLTVVNTNPLYTEREMEHQFRDADVKGLVILNMFAHKLEQVLPLTNIETLIIATPSELYPWPKNMIFDAAAKYVMGMVPKFELVQGYVSFSETLKAGASKALEPVNTQPGDIAFLQYTGGTTGFPKGAILTHRNIIANVEQIGAWMSTQLREGEEFIVTPLPLYHVFALTVNLLVFITYGGENLLISNPRDLDTSLGIMNQYKFTAVTGVNTLFRAMLDHPKIDEVDFSTCKFAVGGAMALQRKVVEDWRAKTGSILIEGYGLTEASPVTHCNPLDGRDQTGTIGLPLPSTEVKLLKEDGSEITELNEPGEICVRGPQVMQGYWNRQEETDNVLDREGWLRTGDIAVWLDNGFSKIVDRKKDMINVSGFNVYPNEIEDVMAGHPGVKEVACIGVEDPKSNEAVKIIVVPRNWEVTAEDLDAYARQHLTGYKRPKYIQFRSEELPKSNVGKVLRRVLKEQDRAEAEQAAEGEEVHA